ncbi:MucR family transcriptional regulator [Pelagibius sp. Alg239-R121]|uniref:MucR family transcriptional regulator n=1 Tax=Pelagibius sp. Alg239-R121 TaxID=2993448 RepID=UPI0024A77920|nr:MucR family transcriptional regulator [Pelagibius sp. Alg239-R121]
MTEPVTSQLTSKDILRMTSDVVASYVRNNPVASDELRGVIQAVHDSLMDLNNGTPGAAEAPKPAVSVRKSITPDYIVCLEDGKKLKMLKRYLRTSYGMTPEEYRAKWGLASDYPMVAPNYAAQRSAFAKKIGLGRGAKQTRRRGKAA